MTPSARHPALAAFMALAACAPTGGPVGGEATGVASVVAEAALGGTLPFGAIASACGVGEGDLGIAIAAQAGYALHDTAPSSTAPRTHFVTGFADGCPRRMTAALVLFGDLATHETMRYESDAAPYSPTDAAYETLKGRECGAPSGSPCGEGLERLAADTAFLTLYPAFGADEGADVLLSGGEVLASDV